MGVPRGNTVPPTQRLSQRTLPKGGAPRSEFSQHGVRSHCTGLVPAGERPPQKGRGERGCSMREHSPTHLKTCGGRAPRGGASTTEASTRCHLPLKHCHTGGEHKGKTGGNWHGRRAPVGRGHRSWHGEEGGVFRAGTPPHSPGDVWRARPVRGSVHQRSQHQAPSAFEAPPHGRGAQKGRRVATGTAGATQWGVATGAGKGGERGCSTREHAPTHLKTCGGRAPCGGAFTR